MENLVVNKIQCLICKDVIESKTRHDYVECSCGNCAVDGGLQYAKRVQKKRCSFIDLSKYKGE